jgi:acetyl coenzyme A synthetase (ADP forming)-like protein
MMFPPDVQAQAEFQALFDPRGIALIGASTDPARLGYGMARNLLHSGYRGAVYLVNLHGGSLFGQPIYQSVLQVPDPLDLAVLLIPATRIPEALHQCGARGVRAVVVASSGFREIGAAGAVLEAEVTSIARQYQMRLLGPNCIGLIDTSLPLNVTFLPPPGPPAGELAFLSHSGAICAALIDWARSQGFGFSRLISLGNQADLNETDLLAPVAADPATRVLTLYLEGLPDGPRFVQQAAQVTRQKPVVALKVGRFASGQRAAASHTGALAGQDSAYQAAFRRAGVVRANTTEELFDWAHALSWCPLPQGRAMAVLTNAGGPGVTAADALEANGLSLAELQPQTLSGLSQLLPPPASLHNPVDMLASATPEVYAGCLQLLLADPGVHGALVIIPPPPTYPAEAIAQVLTPMIQSSTKPVIIALMGERLIETAANLFRRARIPEYRFPERAAAALSVLYQRAEMLAQDNTIPSFPVQREQAQALLTNTAPGFLDASTATALFQAYGLPTLPLQLAATRDQAVQAAAEMGFPVALKIASPDIAHKSDVDGVLLNLRDAQAVRNGFDQIIANARLARPQAEILGAHVQRMLPDGQDVILGALQDAQFGPLVMFGSGGVEVEGLKDVAFALAPLTNADAGYLLQSTWAGRKLDGFRNLPPADREAVQQALFRLGQLAADFPRLAETEINPLRVLPRGQGAVALDIRIRAV